MREVENLIIGAGPGGLAAAEELARAGRDVLVLEKSRVIGKKICAGYLPLNKEARAMGIPESIIRSRIETMRFITPRKEHLLSLESEPRVTFRREDLGQWMADKAIKAGAKIETGATVVEAGRGWARLKDGDKISCANLIGADGCMSVVRKFLGLPYGMRGVVVQTWVPVRTCELKLFFDVADHGVYPAYAIPNGEYTVYGLGGDTRTFGAPRMKKTLERWVRRCGYDKDYQMEGFPVCLHFAGCKFGNVYLVGEAAGLVNDVTVIGIYPAYVSAIETARTILDPSYPAPLLKDLIRSKRLQNFAMSTAARVPRAAALAYEILPSILRHKSVFQSFLKTISGGT